MSNVKELDFDNTMKDAELGNGDIIIFQKPSVSQQTCSTALDFYSYIHNRISVVFYELSKPEEKVSITRFMRRIKIIWNLTFE